MSQSQNCTPKHIDDLPAWYAQTEKSALSVADVVGAEVSKYGIIQPRDLLSVVLWIVRSVIEKPKLEDAPSRLASFGW